MGGNRRQGGHAVIESISDAVQLAVLALCFTLALVRALRERSTVWTSIACFYACMLLGNVYWFGYLIVFGETPIYSYIADMGWIAGYVFLAMLLAETDRARNVSALLPASLIPIVLCAACCIFYIATSGSVLLNIVDNGLLAIIGFYAVRGIAAHSDSSKHVSKLAANKAFHWAVLAFVIVEQALWISSSFLEHGPIAAVNAYIILSYVFTLAYAAILVCALRSDMR